MSAANATLDQIITEITKLQEYIEAQNNPKRTFQEWQGWNHPLITKDDLHEKLTAIKDRIARLPLYDISENNQTKLKELHRRYEISSNNGLSTHIFNGNGSVAIPLLFQLVDYTNEVASQIEGGVGAELIQKKQSEAIKNFRKLQDQFHAISTEAEDLHQKVTAINLAKEAADQLPTTISHLANVTKEIERLSTKSTALTSQTQSYAASCEELMSRLQDYQIRAEEIIKSASSAHSAATAKGLSESFYTRAAQLHVSMRWWVGGLALALLASLMIGYFRFDSLSAALKDAATPWYTILIELVTALLGVAAPVWFAWLASKQISHLFKVAEDYSFKASVSRAYEGFRLETLKYDKKFAEKLLTSALQRLDEEPLRFVDSTNHASPMSELANSPLAKGLLKKFPNAEPPTKPRATETNAEEANHNT